MERRFRPTASNAAFADRYQPAATAGAPVPGTRRAPWSPPSLQRGGHVEADALVVGAHLLARRVQCLAVLPGGDGDQVEGGGPAALLEGHVAAEAGQGAEEVQVAAHGRLELGARRVRDLEAQAPAARGTSRRVEGERHTSGTRPGCVGPTNPFRRTPAPLGRLSGAAPEVPCRPMASFALLPLVALAVAAIAARRRSAPRWRGVNAGALAAESRPP
jgi:hypothetical protein